MADPRSTGSGKFPQSYHLVWLEAHPWRSYDWLQDKIADGFHIHHIDGNHSNDEPGNLALMDGSDHLALHGMKLRQLLVARTKRAVPKKAPYSEEGERLYSLKAEWDCEWKALAQRYFDGVKPDPSRIWSSIGHGLMAKAKAYANHCEKPWPPANYTPRGSAPTQDEVSAMLSRQ